MWLIMKVTLQDRAILRDIIAYSKYLMEANREMDAHDIERKLLLFGEQTKALSDDFMCDCFRLWWEGHSIYDALIATYLDAIDDIDWMRRIRPRLEMFITRIRNVVE